MRGLLVVNHFFQTPKFVEHYEWFERSAKALGIGLDRMTNVDCTLHLAAGTIDPEVDFVLFWDKDTKLCSALEREGFRTFNRAEAIRICDDKSLTYLALSKTGIRQPRTIVVPQVFYPVDWAGSAFSEEALTLLGAPVVAKECFGSFGEQVILASTVEELDSVLNSFEGRPALVQEFIASSKGKDTRIQMVGTEAIAAMERTAQSSDFRSNITNGGVARGVVPTDEQVEFARSVMAALGLDFAGIDIMDDEDGKPVLCEVNSNAHFVNLYDATGVNAADAIIDYIARSMGDDLSTF